MLNNSLVTVAIFSLCIICLYNIISNRGNKIFLILSDNTKIPLPKNGKWEIPKESSIKGFLLAGNFNPKKIFISSCHLDKNRHRITPICETSFAVMNSTFGISILLEKPLKCEFSRINELALSVSFFNVCFARILP